MTLIRLRVCTGWSEALLVAHTTLLEISCRRSYIIVFLFYFQVSLRHQDVTLLKQLIHINDTIHTLSSETKSAKNRSRHVHNKPVRLSASFSGSSTTPCSKWRKSLVRQQSVPRYCDVVPEETELDYSSSGDGKIFCLV